LAPHSIQVVVVDSDVLYKSAVRDFVFEFALAEKLKVHWSVASHHEVLKNLELTSARFVSTFSRNANYLLSAFPDTLVTNLVGGNISGVHAKDIHVAQAAVTVHAGSILTFNLRDFDSSIEFGGTRISALSPDSFFTSLYDTDELGFLQTTSDLIRDFRNPPLNALAFASYLQKSGCPNTAEILRLENQVLAQLVQERAQ